MIWTHGYNTDELWYNNLWYNNGITVVINGKTTHHETH